MCRIEEHLGSGYFGRVERGTWKKGDREIEVALKTLNKTETQDKVKFLQEASLMAQFKHPNIINLFGVASKHQPVRQSVASFHHELIVVTQQIMLVVELMHKGNLQHHLQTLKPAK